MSSKSSRTAMTRSKPSLPIRTLVKRGYLVKEASVFDYGHGKGRDMIWLREQGYTVDGWDPYHKPPEGFLGEGFAHVYQSGIIYDWVCLGYVLNVIDDPGYRIDILKDIYRDMSFGAKISVAVRTFEEVERSSTDKWIPHSDGWLTSIDTFQTGFFPHQLENMLVEAGFDNVQFVKSDPLIAIARKNVDVY